MALKINLSELLDHKLYYDTLKEHSINHQMYAKLLPGENME